MKLHLSNLKRVARQESSRYSIAIRQPKTEIGNRSCTFGTRLRREVIHKWQPLGLERKIYVLGLKQSQAETETWFFCTLIKKNIRSAFTKSIASEQAPVGRNLTAPGSAEKELAKLIVRWPRGKWDPLSFRFPFAPFSTREPVHRQHNTLVDLCHTTKE